MSDVELWGLKTCGKCRKVRKTLENSGLSVVFRDVRSAPLSAAEIAELVDQFSDRSLNRASTTWRNLEQSERARPAGVLIAAYPALMKRPVIRRGNMVWQGWDSEIEAAVLGLSDPSA